MSLRSHTRDAQLLMPTDALPRLREALSYAYHNTKLTRDKFDAVGVLPQNIRDSPDLAMMPATTRAEYRREFPAGVLAGGATLHDPMVVRSRSSGTAYERLLSADYSYTLAERRLGALAANPPLLRVLADPETRRSVRYAAPNCSDVECALPQTTIRDRILPNGMLVLPAAHDLYATSTQMLRQAWNEIVDWRPDYLSCDPTRLAHLLRYLDHDDPQDIPGRALVMTYNFAPAFATAYLRRRLPTGMTVANSVTMSECGWVAVSCPHGTLHLNTAELWMELVDADLAPVAVGEVGELVVTSLGEPLSPRVRYLTGDLYQLLDGCPCGHRHPAVRFEGRWRNAPVCSDGSRMSMRELDDLIGAPEHLVSYRFHQHAPDRAELRYMSSTGNVSEWEHSMRDRLRARLGKVCQIVIDVTAFLPAERSGKFVTCTTAVS